MTINVTFGPDRIGSYLKILIFLNFNIINYI